MHTRLVQRSTLCMHAAIRRHPRDRHTHVILCVVCVCVVRQGGSKHSGAAAKPDSANTSPREEGSSRGRRKSNGGASTPSSPGRDTRRAWRCIRLCGACLLQTRTKSTVRVSRPTYRTITIIHASRAAAGQYVQGPSRTTSGTWIPCNTGTELHETSTTVVLSCTSTLTQ